jgi:Fe-S oxidoreductase
MKGLEVPLCRDGAEFDVLLWVGCAGATDPGAQRTTRAVAQLLQKAGVRFACLGREEQCTGDAARRAGDEFLFQEKAQANVETFKRYSVKRIVTPCPHCLNTLKHEYEAFGAQLQVEHHSQILASLVRERRLEAANPEFGSVTFHDPCYLGRVNEESEAPRTVLAMESPERLAEPPNRGAKTLCCGAGGGRMWMEEPADQRPGVRRAEELKATGAKTVAVGCPFCRIMLDASFKQTQGDDIRLVDLAELALERNTPVGGSLAEL